MRFASFLKKKELFNSLISWFILLTYFIKVPRFDFSDMSYFIKRIRLFECCYWILNLLISTFADLNEEYLEHLNFTTLFFILNFSGRLFLKSKRSLSLFEVHGFGFEEALSLRIFRRILFSFFINWYFKTNNETSILVENIGINCLEIEAREWISIDLIKIL